MSLQPSALPKGPTSRLSAFSTKAKTLSFDSHLPRFGGQDVFLGGDALPDWANGVKDPQFTRPDLQKKREALAKAQSERAEQSNLSTGETKKKMGPMCLMIFFMALTI